VGLLGNPSDGFEGKTVSFELENFGAEVIVRELYHSPTVVIHPHPVLDPSSFHGGIAELVRHTSLHGYYGGIRLVQATVKRFYEILASAGLSHVLDGRGFEVFYNTDIPRMVGLSGSSAIVVATMRALMSFTDTDLVALRIAKTAFPSVILNIEKLELGISAGLQDRVIQVYGGLVHMDFSPAATRTPRQDGEEDGPAGIFTPLDPKLLPKMYLAYDVEGGGDSGKVHSTVQARWREREPQLVEGMTRLGELADAGVAALKMGGRKELAALMAGNFATRRKLYGDAVVGRRNIDAVQIAADCGLAAKFTGSGGALVCLRVDGTDAWLDEAAEARLCSAFESTGFKCVRILESKGI
jgi:glucuronokinase